MIHERVRERAAADPARLAVSDQAGTLSYGELEARANALAHLLRARGAGRGARVGLCHERGAQQVVGALAVLKAGAAYVGLDPAYPDARLAAMLRDASASILLAGTSVCEAVRSVCADVIDLDHDAVCTSQYNDPPDVATGLDDVAYVIYTSGSTGEPKGVEVAHSSLLGLVDWHCDAFALGPSDRTSIVASPAFDASVWEIWPTLAAGASLHVPAAITIASPVELRDWMVAVGLTVSFVPTPIAEGLLTLDWAPDASLRVLLTGGDVLHRRPDPALPFTVVNNYGVTEATVVTTSGPVAPRDRGVDVPGIGRPILGAHVHVLDPDGRPVPAGEPGELYIGGQGVAIGYVDRPRETAARFVPDPCTPGARVYRTGDLVRVDDDGELRFLGRLDTQVQIRGHRVELDEIAAVLGSNDAVDECAVIARATDSGTPRIVAYVVGASTGWEALRGFLAERLPTYMLPNAFVELDALPLTANGKLDRAALPDPPHADVRRAQRDATTIESIVVAMLIELLDVDDVRADDNFFELGGHSLMGAQLVARIEDCFDVEMELLTIFDHPTAAGIAACIADQAGRSVT